MQHQPFLSMPVLGSTVLAAISCAVVLCGPSLNAQVGGEYQTSRQIQGSSSGDQLGTSNAGAGDVDADGFDDFIVGVPYANPLSMPDAGSVFVYSGATGAVLYQFDGTASAERLGFTVAGAGDVDLDGFADLLIGAPYASPNGLSLAGSVFVYSGATGALLFRFDGVGPSDLLGWSLDGVGDANGDGAADLFMGSWSINPTGRAYLYSGLDGSLLHQFDGAASGDFFGWSLSGAGDVDGDGLADLIVGSHGAQPGGRWQAGTAYVYSGSSGVLLYQFDGLANSDNFGWAVSAAGDVNRDGFADLLIGAKFADPNLFGNAGAAYIYSGANGTLLYQFDGANPGDGLGSVVADAGDMDGDGFDDVLVAAIDADPANHESAGSVYLYSGASGLLLHQFDGSARFDAFGTSLSAVGDVNGDGFSDVVIGAPFASSLDLGSSQIFGLNPFLTPTSLALSAASGGVVDLQLEFPDAAGLDEYKVLFSTTGTGPILFGIEIPLNLDAMLRRTNLGHYPFPNSSGLQGSLDAAGDANASFTVPSGLSSSLIGRVFWMAAVANSPAQFPEYSSVAVAIEVVP